MKGSRGMFEKSNHATMYSPSPRLACITRDHRKVWGVIEDLFAFSVGGGPSSEGYTGYEDSSECSDQIFSSSSRHDRLFTKPESLEISLQRLRIARRWLSWTHSEPTINSGQRRYTSDCTALKQCMARCTRCWMCGCRDGRLGSARRSQ